jgi:hypothetical protein
VLLPSIFSQHNSNRNHVRHRKPTLPIIHGTRLMTMQLHTDAGDIKIEVFCEAVPKTAEVSPIYMT